MYVKIVLAIYFYICRPSSLTVASVARASNCAREKTPSGMVTLCISPYKMNSFMVG